MSDDLRNQVTRGDEIDLLVLLERTLAFFKRYRGIFIFAAVLGLLLGYLRYATLPVVYKSRMVMHSFVLTNQNDIQIVANWDALLKSGESAALTPTLQLDAAALHKIKKIKAEEIQKIFTPNNPNGFTIDVLVTDNSILPALQKGIVYAFENSEYVRDRLWAKRNRLEEMITRTTAELVRIDSTKKLVDNIISGKGQSASLLIVDASNINRQWIDLNEKLLGLKEELKFTNAVQVLQGFSAFKNPAGPNLWVWLFLGLASCFFLAYCYTLGSAVNDTLKKRRASIQIAD